MAEPRDGEYVTLSGDAEHVYVTDANGHVVSMFDTLAQAEAALRCACRGTGMLDGRVIDGTQCQIRCPWCAAAFGSQGGSDEPPNS
jgi:hypothetical protein